MLSSIHFLLFDDDLLQVMPSSSVKIGIEILGGWMCSRMVSTRVSSAPTT